MAYSLSERFSFMDPVYQSPIDNLWYFNTDPEGRKCYTYGPFATEVEARSALEQYHEAW